MKSSSKAVAPMTGHNAFTRILSGASSTAMAFDIKFTAPFEALYQTKPGRGRMPAVEPTLIIRPPLPRARISGVEEVQTLAATLNDAAAVSELVPVEPGQYHFWEPGQQWAEPDIDCAARLMRELRDDAALRHRIGSAAQRHMRMHHSPEAVARFYAERIAAIHAAAEISG